MCSQTKTPNRISFKDHNIYVGIDVHQRSWTVSILVEEIHHKTLTMPPDPAGLHRYLVRHFPGATYKSVYEAGFSGFGWHRALTDLSINNIVVNPADVPTTFKETKTKRDSVDSLKLAQTLRSGLLRGIYVPTAAQVELRSLSRGRALLMRNVRVAKLRILSLLRTYGVRVPERFSGKLWTLKFRSWLEEISVLTAAGRRMLDFYIADWLHTQNQISRLGKTLQAAMQQEFEVFYELLLSIPGVGPLTAASVLTEVFPMSRFRNFSHLCSYVGLIPSTHSSGDKERVGKLTPRKNYYLVPLLIEASWTSIRKDPALLLYYRARAVRIGGRKAIVKVARKLLSRIRHVLVYEEAYELSVH